MGMSCFELGESTTIFCWQKNASTLDDHHPEVQICGCRRDSAQRASWKKRAAALRLQSFRKTLATTRRAGPRRVDSMEKTGGGGRRAVAAIELAPAAPFKHYFARALAARTGRPMRPSRRYE